MKKSDRRSPATNSVPAGSGSGVDLFSRLTDDLIIFILTLLPLSTAIRTCVLSIRWRDLWKRRWLPPAHFDFTSVELPSELFAAHISHSLLVRHPPPRRIDTLRIAFRPRTSELPELREWMSYASACHVADITLDLTSPKLLPERFPIFFFDYKNRSLQRLRIAGCRVPPALDFKNMPCLKTVCLYGAHIRHQTVLNLLHYCRRLRSLELRCCTGLNDICIAARRLRLTRLAIIDCPGITAIVIIASNLRSLHIRGELLFARISGFRALEDAYITWGTRQHMHLPAIKQDWKNKFAKFAGVRVLTVCGLSLQFITGYRKSVKFPYLGELQLMIPILTNENLGDIFGFFKLCSCPRLEKLFIELPVAWYGSAMQFVEREEEELMLVWFEKLKVIKMNNFTGYYNEMRLVSFLLQSTINLEFLILVPTQVKEEEDPNVWDHNQLMLSLACNTLNSLSKVSPNAVIIFEEGNGRSMFHPTHDPINI